MERNFIDIDMYESKEAKISYDLINAITAFHEAYSNDHYISEKTSDGIFGAIVKFFADLIANMKSLKDSISLQVSKKVRETSYKMQLAKLYKSIEENRKQGKTTMEVTDIWGIEQAYLDSLKDLKKLALRFTSNKYTSIIQIDDDLSEFYSKVDYHDKKIEEACKKKVNVPIEKLLNFVESESSGHSKIMDTMNDAIYVYNQMQKDAELLEKRKDILGPDILPKNIGFIRKCALKIGGFIKKWVVKIMTTLIFLF